ncbi:MAG: putative rane protein [Frankiales bacterium]|nr:putative rane protein [Frankiales bacterium]
MSATTMPNPRPSSTPVKRVDTRAPLAVVRTRPAPARAPFVILIAALLVAGLVLLLLLNTALTQGAFQQKSVAREVKQLVETEQSLRDHLAHVQEPDSLAKNARALGLVPSTCPVFLRLPAGTVLGTPCPAAAPPAPKPKPVKETAPDAQAGKTLAGKTLTGNAATKTPATKTPATKTPATKSPATKTASETTSNGTTVKTRPVTTTAKAPR